MLFEPEFDKKDEIYRFLRSSAICEVAGGKGSGKTCLLLHFLENYLKMNETSF